jgi:hypothetical protein
LHRHALQGQCRQCHGRCPPPLCRRPAPGRRRAGRRGQSDLQRIPRHLDCLGRGWQGDDDAYSRQVRADNPFLKATTDKRGYLLCDIIRKEWTGDLKVVDKVTKPGGKLSTYARFIIENGHPGLNRV